MKRVIVIAWVIIFLSNNALAVAPNIFNETRQWCFDCSFLWLDSVAKLSLTVEPQLTPNIYRIILHGQGQGFVAWLHGDRHQYYESLVRLDSDGRVTTLTHLQQTQINHNGQRIQYGWKLSFDEFSTVVVAERLWGGNVVETMRYCQVVTSTIEERVVGDFLGALFSFMCDSSQPLVVGLQYDFLMFYRDGDASLRIKVIRNDEVQNTWQCLISSDEPILPGGVTELIFYCDEKRIPLSGGSDTFFGGVSIHGTRCVE
jgi:hypothetical protein